MMCQALCFIEFLYYPTTHVIWVYSTTCTLYFPKTYSDLTYYTCFVAFVHYWVWVYRCSSYNFQTYCDISSHFQT